MIKFKYNDKIYQTKDLDKKLSQMNLTKDDIELLEDKVEEIESIPLHYLFNTRNGHVMVGIQSLEEIKKDTFIKQYDWEEWIEITKEQHDEYYRTGLLRG